MPIEVRHGLPGEALAVAGAGVGAGQGVQRELDRAQRDAHLAARLQQQRELTLAQIGARADLQRQAADTAMAKTALRAGLDEHLREQYFEQQLELQQQEAVAKAKQWDYKFTTEQRQQIARLNNARQRIMQSDAFTPAERQEALKLLELQQAGIEPEAMPRDPSEPTYPDGQGVGQVWQTESGTLLTRGADGEPTLLQRFDQSPEYHQAKLEMEREKAVLEMRKELMTEQIEQVDDQGNTTYRQRTPEEVDSMVRVITGSHAEDGQLQRGGHPEPAAGAQGQPGRSGQPQQQQPQPWHAMAKQRGLDVRQSDTRLPPNVGYALAMIRTQAKQYASPEVMPPEIREAFREAQRIVLEYRAAQHQ